MQRGPAVFGALVAVAAGCAGPVVDIGADASTSTSTPESSSSGMGDTTAASPTAADTTSGTTGDDTPSCVPTVEIGAFTQITGATLGRLQVYDFDTDGLPDLVGASGAIALARADGFELVPSPEPITPSWCRAGRFDADDTADLVFSISDHRLRMHPGGAVEPVVDTDVDHVSDLAPRDMDGDDIDDLVIVIDNGTSIQSWRGTATGVFEQTDAISVAGLGSGVFAELDPPRVDMIVTDTSELRVLVGDGAGTFTPADSVGAPSSGLLEVVRAGDRDALAMSWAWSQLETYSGVGLVFRDDRGVLVGRAYSLSPRWPAGSVAGADLDGDGQPELVTGVDDPVDGLVLEVACGTGQEMLRCGATSIEHAADWLALLPGPAGIRLAYSTGQDGTWIAPISVTPC